MDTYSSGEDLFIKTRKPYTITKQRERWTEEEHNRFLEALKLYGRAWQRIEEHIGTKTAVQIRSHAQKFFSKLEKEALVKGVPVGQALDIDIPPPRPKRKPSNPYPRKTSIGASPSQVGAKDGKVFTSVSSHTKQGLDLEKEPLPEKPNGDEKAANAKDNQDENCSRVFTLFQEAHHSSVSSVNKSSARTAVEPRNNSCVLREFIPSVRGALVQDETNESYLTVEHKGNQNSEKADKQTVQDTGTSKGSKSENSHVIHEKSYQGEKTDDLNCGFQRDEIQAAQNYPRHVPVQVLDGSQGTCTQTPSSDMSFQDSIFHQMREVPGHPNQFANPAASATTDHQNNVPRSSVHQSFPAFHTPFTPICHNQDDYRSYLHVSSTFSSLIVSTLMQNPAAHAAASFAATFLPYANVETPADSHAGTQGGFPLRQMGCTPSMAAIAAATVAAATAWWAAHGLLPLCAPLHTAYSCTPASAADTPMDGQASKAKLENEENALQNPPTHQVDPDLSETVQAQHSASKSPTLSSSDSEESGGAKLSIASKANDHEKPAAASELHDSNKTKNRKPVDRSSCGSNTASSSEVETDALAKGEKVKDESIEPDANHPASEAGNRRSRSASNISDPWKEVSEGGRLAFQALFSREVLPQSFSPPHDAKNKGQQNDNINEDKQIAYEKDRNASLLDLNSLKCGPCPSPQGNSILGYSNDREEGLFSVGLGQGKLKARRTGFKPYKRCSVEAKENIVTNASSLGEEKCPKRIRLEGEPST